MVLYTKTRIVARSVCDGVRYKFQKIMSRSETIRDKFVTFNEMNILRYLHFSQTILCLWYNLHFASLLETDVYGNAIATNLLLNNKLLNYFSLNLKLVGYK